MMDDARKRIVRRLRDSKDKLEKSREEYIRSQGWRQEMLGWFWVWKRQYTDKKGEVHHLCNRNVDEAMEMQNIIDELEWNQ